MEQFNLTGDTAAVLLSGNGQECDISNSIVVDTNPGENPIYEHIADRRPNIAVCRKRLDVCDIEVRHGGQTICIERKTWSDLAASICDGRFHEQKVRMVPADGVMYAYVIEGEIASWDGSLRNMSHRSLWGALVKTALRDNFVVFHAATPRDIAELCIYLFEQLRDGGFAPKTAGHCVAGVQKRKRDNLNDAVSILRAMLVNIPGMSATRADKVLAAFPDVPSLCAAEQSRLAAVDCGDRRLGPKLASQLKSVFGTASEKRNDYT